MKYSIVVPIYNDGALAADFCRSAERRSASTSARTTSRATSRSSSSTTAARTTPPRILKEVCDEFPFARMAVLSRNFGQHIAISAGYRFARGEYVGMMNVDQEDPLDQVPLLLDELQKGDWDIVGGALRRTATSRWLNKVTSYLFNVMLNRLTGYDTPLNSATVRFMTRRSVDAYNSLTEKQPLHPRPRDVARLPLSAACPVKHRARTGRQVELQLPASPAHGDCVDHLVLRFPAPPRGQVRAARRERGPPLLARGRSATSSSSARCSPAIRRRWPRSCCSAACRSAVTGVASLYVGRVLAEVQGRPLFLVRETYGGLTSADALSSAPSRPAPSLHA